MNFTTWSEMYLLLKSETTRTGRAAIIADDVQRGLGMLPQQAICEDSTRGKIEEMRLRDPVDTACQFVKASILIP